MHYDIIGDLHGHADALEALLRKMDYAPSSSAWRHSERTAVFVGDFIDRGPQQVRTVELVRAMVESGAALAVMGNHELNAIAWHTPHPDGSGDFLRPHHHPVWGPKNLRQHAHFLAEVERDRQLHRDIIAWFKTLPLWLDLPGIRVVHACWHQRLMDWLAPHLTADHQLTDELLAPATLEPADRAEQTSATPSVFKAVEALLKGIEIPLPPSHSFRTRMTSNAPASGFAGGTRTRARTAMPPSWPTHNAASFPRWPFRSTRRFTCRKASRSSSVITGCAARRTSLRRRWPAWTTAWPCQAAPWPPIAGAASRF